MSVLQCVAVRIYILQCIIDLPICVYIHLCTFRDIYDMYVYLYNCSTGPLVTYNPKEVDIYIYVSQRGPMHSAVTTYLCVHISIHIRIHIYDRYEYLCECAYIWYIFKQIYRSTQIYSYLCVWIHLMHNDMSIWRFWQAL